MKDGQAYVSAREVADYLGIHVRTVKRIDPFELPYIQFGKRGDRHYKWTEVEDFIRRMRVR